MKKKVFILASLIILLAVTSCPDKEPTTPAGYGTVRLTFSQGTRTAMPDIDLEMFSFEFFFNDVKYEPAEKYTFTLPVGNYKLKVNAYLKEDTNRETVAAAAEAEITVTGGTNAPVAIALKPAGGEGTLRFNVKYEGNTDGVFTVSLYMLDILKGETLSANVLNLNIPVNNQESFNVNIPAGFYTLQVILQKNESQKYSYACKTMVVHIYNGKSTDIEITFNDNDFYKNVVTNTEDLGSDFASAGSLRKVINEADDWSTIRFMLPLNSSKTISFRESITINNKNIIIQANDDIEFVRQGSFFSSIFTVDGGQVEASLTLTTTEEGSLTIIGSINGIDTGSLITVNQNGTFIMDGNVVLTANKAEGNGGAVYVNGGTFYMYDGEISWNYAQSGGGVYVERGTFLMSGGEIKSNTALGEQNSNTEFVGNDGGGGVYLYKDNVVFKKTGGIIYGNNAGDNSNLAINTDLGHAVYVQDGSGGSERHQYNNQRNSTAGENVNLDSSLNDEAGGWD